MTSLAELERQVAERAASGVNTAGCIKVFKVQAFI